MLDALRAGTGFNLAPGAFKNEVWLLRLQAAVRLTRRLGVLPAQLFQWATVAPSAAQAQDIKQTIKALYDEETWLTVAGALHNRLRESQRDALTAYLLPRLGLSDSNQLFEFFLIDVDMGACMATSRIKQAIASVQLFVQRCLMNLEPAVGPTTIDPDLWQWMKQYRMWEANRKVFLYPENWLEPELRDDQSPFFKELRTELLQSDMTPEVAETALLHYLTKLDQVDRLEICGLYWQLETDETGQTIDVLHVFGRTFAIPHIYYYRRLKNRSVWTAWERVDLDIAGDHLLPVVFNRRLYLFWPIFTQKVPADQRFQPRTRKGRRRRSTGRSAWPGVSTSRATGCRNRFPAGPTASQHETSSQNMDRQHARRPRQAPVRVRDEHPGRRAGGGQSNEPRPRSSSSSATAA